MSFAGLGGLLAGVHDFSLVWPPIPKAVVWHGVLATIYGATLLGGGIALLAPRMARSSALVLTAILLLRLLWLEAPHVAAHPLIEGVWEDFSENLAFVAGGWTIFSMLPRARGALANFGSVRVGQLLFALALPAFGLSHMFYMNMTAPLIPAWLPFHVPLAWFTGVAHIAAGAGIFFGVLPRLAATLEAVMVSLFTLLVWPPMLVAMPASRANWSEICVSAAISAAAWAVAESFREAPWTRRSRSASGRNSLAW
ncbi:MAG TPA: hypothetical protein VIY09_08105 [Rhizomicrobium sp.]